MNGVTLPPQVSVHKDRIAGQWVYTFRHSELGRLGRIVLQARSDGNTQLNCELAGEPDDPMTAKRAAIFKPLSLEITEKAQMVTGGPPRNRVLEEPVSPSTLHQIATKHMTCEKCDADVAFLIFADRARNVGELEDYARMMHSKVVELDVPTWVIGEPVGNDPPPERPADIIKIWPEREPVRRLRPDEFNPMVDELIATHCRLRRKRK